MTYKSLQYLFVLKISEGDLVHAALKPIRCNSGTLSPVDEGLANLTDLEDGGSLDVVPIFAGEGINNLFLHTLLASFGEALKITEICYLSSAPTN